MALHGLAKVTIGVPNLQETIAYYTEFGLTHRGAGVFATGDGGEQLELVHSPVRRLVELAIAAEDEDDLGTIASRLSQRDVPSTRSEAGLHTIEPITGTSVTVQIRPRIVSQPPVE